jgi:hypothetical protein
LSKCKVDWKTSPTLASLLKKLKKKYPHILDDLIESIPDIETDYTHNCGASRPPKRKVDFEFWKYEFGSSDLRRSPANSFRVIGIFLSPEEAGIERTMYLSIAYWKGDQGDVTTKEVEKAVERLMEAINQGDLPEEEATCDPDLKNGLN